MEHSETCIAKKKSRQRIQALSQFALRHEGKNISTTEGIILLKRQSYYVHCIKLHKKYKFIANILLKVMVLT